uniref:Ubiquitin-like protease family profile domain-containing protein n=1 Tax=Brassica oleracea var. oleracea TaxID=109376 RepID=A0A0D3AW99_BRAOL
MKRLNVYSKPDILCFLRHVLRGSDEFEIIRNSCFGRLFDIPARQSPVSYKLLHNLLCRQILPLQEYTLWPVVGGSPFRFSLAEFHTVTGLPCGHFPESYETPSFNIRNPAKDPLWQKLLGHDSHTTIADIRHMLETDQTIPKDKRLRLALIMIVDGVFIAHKQVAKPTLHYVRMVDNLEDFLNFPWGRESFLKTITCMKPPTDATNPVGALAQLSVTSLIPLAPNAQSWGGETVDERVCYMEKLIAENHKFKPADWPGGDTSNPEFIFTAAVQTVHRKHTVPKKQPLKVNNAPTKGPSSSRKQRRISNYFKTNAASAAPTNDWLAAKIREHDIALAQLQSDNRRLKLKIRKRHRKPGCKLTTMTPTFRKAKAKVSQDISPDETNNGQRPASTPPPALRPASKATNVEMHQEIRSSQPQQDAHLPDCEGASSQPQTTKLPQQRRPQDTTHSSPRLTTPTPISPVVSQYNAQRFSANTNEIITDDADLIINNVIGSIEPAETSSTPQRPHQSASAICMSPQQPSQPHISFTNNSPTQAYPQTTSCPNTAQKPSPIKNPLPNMTPTSSPGTQSSPAKNNLPINHNPLTQASPTHDIQISSTPPRLYQTTQSAPLISSKPNRINQVWKPGSIKTPSQLGFIAHTSTVNAFASQATSNTPPTSSTSVQKHSGSLLEATSDLVCVSDSSPSKPLPDHVPSMPEEELARLMINSPSIPATLLFAPIDPQLREFFHKTLQNHKDMLHINPYTTAFTNSSLIKLATPEQWTDSTQMEVLMYRAGASHQTVLAKENSLFVKPWLTSYIQKKWRQFNAAVDKDKFRWDTQLSKLVLLPGQKWVSNIHTIYAPMIWDDRNWVGLAINLPLSHVEVLDPFLTLYGERKAKTALQPVLEMLPFVISKLTTNSPSQFDGARPLTFQRRMEIYISHKGGDCGPLSVKFMEMHANEDPDPHMAELTDEMVVEMRKQYAIDTYRNIVIPTYSNHYPPTTTI